MGTVFRVTSLNIFFRASLLLFLFALCIGTIGVAWADGENITTPSNKTGLAGTPIAITDLQVTGEGNDEVSLALSVNSGQLSFGDSVNVTVLEDGTNEVSITGLREDVNIALQNLTYTSNGVGTYTITVTFGTTLTGVITDPDTGYAYKIIDQALTWQSAVTAAAELEYGGVTGYLANITSAEEDAFIAENLSDSVWIGANDIDVEGDWKWHGGPEAGTSFWSGDSAGSPVGGAYSNWNSSEPNNAGAGEDCAEYIIGDGWNDLPCSGVFRNYIVEFGSTGDLPDPIIATFTVTTSGTNVSVATCVELQALHDSEPNRFANITLTHNIDCSGIENFAPLNWGAPFGGTFDGQGFTISNLTIEGVDASGFGLFQYVQNAHFDDIIIENVTIDVPEDSADCGVLAGGASDTSLTNIQIKNADVTCLEEVGGVFGYLEINDDKDIEISRVSVVGGQLSADMYDSVGSNAGGLFGYVHIYDYANLTIEEVYTDITVTARDREAGGLFGNIYNVNDDDDGVPDSVFTVRNAYVKGDTSVILDDHAGGISGGLEVANGDYDALARVVFENVYVSGDVSGDSEVGGFIGDILTLAYGGEEVEFRNSFFSGEVTGNNTNETHALFGDDDFIDGGTLTMVGVYFDKTASGQTLAMYIEDYAGITAVNTDGSEQNYFIGNSTNAPMSAWDFEDVWVVATGGTPLLRAFTDVVEETPQTAPSPEAPIGNGGIVGSGFFSPNFSVTVPAVNTHTPDSLGVSAGVAPPPPSTEISPLAPQSPSLPIPIFTRDLGFGSSGDDVFELQKFLNSEGYMLSESGPGSPGNETTTFGTATRNALARFQSAHGIVPAVGYLGPITRAFIANMSTTPSISPPASLGFETEEIVRDLEVGMSGDDVRLLQELLISRGYAIPAGATGFFGNQTREALRAYQSDNGIVPAVGYFGPVTRAHMKSAGIVGVWW